MDKQMSLAKQWELHQKAIADSLADVSDGKAEQGLGYFYHQADHNCPRCGYFCEC